MSKQNKNQKNYKMLSKVFETWYLNEYEKAYNEFSVDTCPKELLKAKGINHNEFYAIYIQPFEELDEHLLELTLKALSANLREKSSSKEYCYNISKQYRIGRRLNALQWLLAQVVDVNLFELSQNLKDKYKKPYKQCMYCGQPDFYIIANKNKSIKEKVIFDEKKKCCHAYGCEISSTNLNDHVDDCHYKKWRQCKKNLRQNLDRTYKLLETKPEDKIYIYTKLQNIFMDFCKNQLKMNYEIDYTIQFFIKPTTFYEGKELVRAMHYSELSL